MPVSPVTAGVACTTNRDTLAFTLELCRRCPCRAFLDLHRVPDGLFRGVLGGGKPILLPERGELIQKAGVPVSTLAYSFPQGPHQLTVWPPE